MERWKNPQRELFGDVEEYCYYGIATNYDGEEMSGGKVIHWHNGRGNSENYNKELKNGFRMDYMPSGDYGANAVWFGLGILAYHILINEGWMAIRLFENVRSDEKNKKGEAAAKRAIEDYSTMISLDPLGVAGRIERARAYIDYLGDYEKAISDLNIMIEKIPEKAYKYIYTRGYCYRKLNRLDEAAMDWEKSISLKPDYRFPYEELAIYYSETKKEPYNTKKYLNAYLEYTEKIKDPNYAMLTGNMIVYSKFFSGVGQCSDGDYYYRKADQYEQANQMKMGDYGGGWRKAVVN